MTETGSLCSAPKPLSQHQGVEMRKRKESELFTKPVKELWHKLSLQGLTPKRFVEIVNKIINGELRLHK